MRLVQYIGENGETTTARVASDDAVWPIRIDGGTRALARAALAATRSLADEAEHRGYGPPQEYDRIVAEQRLLPPLTHDDPAHCVITGTGLTHLGSAGTRDAMHAGRSEADESDRSDSMKMFDMGLEAGKPGPGAIGAQPEWFYKGDGHVLAAPEQALTVPSFARDAGEEPEIVGLYLIGNDGRPYRLGFALGNELSDHVTERDNYLWLAHSKLRSCSVGPELRTGALPARIEGTSRIHRDNRVLWEKNFLTGEDHMSHSIANLEHHHFKYRQFRRPGDVHMHFMGTATLSFADDIVTRPGDRFDISAPAFGRALRNTLDQEPADHPVSVGSL